MRERGVALVMAGGEGTRLARTHPAVPKPLVRLAGIPLLELTLRRLVKAGFGDIRLALRHGADQIIRYLEQRAARPERHLTYLVEPEPLGTIGALVELRGEERTVLVTNGDLLSGIDLGAMLAFHARQRADLTIATHVEYHRLELGEVIAGPDRRIIDYREKPVKEYRISSGTYLVEPPVLALLGPREWLGFPTLVRRALAHELRVLEHFHTDPWIDINDARDLAEANDMLRKDPVAFGVEPEWVA